MKDSLGFRFNRLRLCSRRSIAPEPLLKVSKNAKRRSFSILPGLWRLIEPMEMAETWPLPLLCMDAEIDRKREREREREKEVGIGTFTALPIKSDPLKGVSIGCAYVTGGIRARIIWVSRQVKSMDQQKKKRREGKERGVDKSHSEDQ